MIFNYLFCKGAGEVVLNLVGGIKYGVGFEEVRKNFKFLLKMLDRIIK